MSETQMPDKTKRPRYQQVADLATGEKIQVIYAIPPELIEGADAYEDNGIALGRLMTELWSRRWIIFVGFLLGGLIGALHALSQANVYTATVTALPPSGSGGGGDLAQYAGLAEIAGVQLPTGPASSVDEIMAILDSRRLAEPLIRRYKLESYYAKDSGSIPREDLLAAFRGDFVVGHSQKGNRISFSYTHQDPSVAMRVANGASDLLKAIFNEIHQSSARKELAFLDGRLQQAQADQRHAAQALAAFQRDTGAIEIEAQTKATIETIAELQGELIGQQVELRALLASQTSEDHPRIRLLQEGIAAVHDEMQRLLGDQQEDDSVFLALGTAPELSVRYLSLLREVKKQEAILAAVAAQRQAAEVNVARANEAIAIVDPAVLPEKKSGPRRTLQLALGSIGAGLLSILMVLLYRLVQISMLRQ